MQVVHCEYVTRQDHPAAQGHEKLGTVRAYQHFDDIDVSVGVHIHDRNLAVSKVAREAGAINQNDLWHAIKKLKMSLEKLGQGPQYLKNKTWFEELKDKPEPVCTHVHWAVRNCGGDSVKLRNSLDNIVEHYKNNHVNCHATSRCRTQKEYIMGRHVLTNPKADKALLSAIHSSVIYKSPGDYVMAKDSHYVESFNNVLNVFQDKRVNFSSEVYQMRGRLATCQWNENVDRPFTSVNRRPSARAPRRRVGKKAYKKHTYQWRGNIWQGFLKSLLQ